MLQIQVLVLRLWRHDSRCPLRCETYHPFREITSECSSVKKRSITLRPWKLGSQDRLAANSQDPSTLSRSPDAPTAMPDMPSGMQEPSRRPLVSVIMANWQGEKYIAEAIASVLAQSIGDFEVLVADDASSDRSAEIVRELALVDSRVRLLAAKANAGPSAARNRALAAARGEWIAIMDSDDLMHPRRLELLLAAAGRLGADIVADDMAAFGDGPGLGGWTLLGPLRLTDTLSVSPAFFVESNGSDRRLPQLGYLKPLIRRSALGELRYDPRIRVGEDYDLYLRLLLQGARFVLLPLPLYLYRRHPASLSHRLSVQVLEPLLSAHVELVRSQPSRDPELRRALRRRGRMLERALRYERLVAAIKGRSAGPGVRLVLRDPVLLRLLAKSLAERWTRPTPSTVPDGAPTRRVALVSAGHGSGQDTTGDDVLTAWPLQVERLDNAPDVHALSCRLTGLASQGPVDVRAMGLDAVDALGLLPGWRSAEIVLTKVEAANLPARLPPGMRLTLVDGSG